MNFRDFWHDIQVVLNTEFKLMSLLDFNICGFHVYSNPNLIATKVHLTKKINLPDSSCRLPVDAFYVSITVFDLIMKNLFNFVKGVPSGEKKLVLTACLMIETGDVHWKLFGYLLQLISIKTADHRADVLRTLRRVICLDSTVSYLSKQPENEVRSLNTIDGRSNVYICGQFVTSTDNVESVSMVTSDSSSCLAVNKSIVKSA